VVDAEALKKHTVNNRRNDDVLSPRVPDQDTRSVGTLSKRMGSPRLFPAAAYATHMRKRTAVACLCTGQLRTKKSGVCYHSAWGGGSGSKELVGTCAFVRVAQFKRVITAWKAVVERRCAGPFSLTLHRNIDDKHVRGKEAQHATYMVVAIAQNHRQ